MRQATVIVGHVNTHSRPGGDDTINGVARRGETFDVIERVDDRGKHPRAIWLYLRASGGRTFWIAERNRSSGAVFMAVEAARIDPPLSERPALPPWWVEFIQIIPWWALALLAGLVVLVFALAGR